MIVEGKLILRDDLTLNYEVHIDGGNIFHLSKLLDYIYMKENSNHIKIRIFKGKDLLFSGNSYLYKNKNDLYYLAGNIPLGKGKYFYSYCIEGDPDLESILFNCTNEYLRIELTSKAIGDGNYEQFFTRAKTA